MASLSLFAMTLCTSKHCLKKHLQHVTIEGCTRGLVQRSQRPISLNSSTMFRQRSKTKGAAKSYLRGVKYWFASFHVEPADANAMDVFKKIYSSGHATQWLCSCGTHLFRGQAKCGWGCSILQIGCLTKWRTWMMAKRIAPQTVLSAAGSLPQQPRCQQAGRCGRHEGKQWTDFVGHICLP